MEKTLVKKKMKWIIILFIIVVLTSAFLIYTENYYHAESSALEELKTDKTVSVTQTDYGWLFDGPSERDILIFYPGAKVEETAYAPLLHHLAEQGMDVCLVKMPFRFAVFGADKAEHVMEMYDYAHWYIGGHSLGGAIAANYAAEHTVQLTGVILLAAYPTKVIDDSLILISIYGSEDGVLNMTRMAEGEQYVPGNSTQYVIEGGNHARFGNYGEQKGDGKASISAEEQQRRTVELISQCISNENTDN